MVQGDDNDVQGPSREEEKGRIEVAGKEDPPNSLQREEVNNNDLGRRSPWWGGGRKEPATTIKAGASSWWGSFTQCGGTPRMMAGTVH